MRGGGLTDNTMAMEAGGEESQGHRKKGVRLPFKKRQQKEEGGNGIQRRRRGGGEEREGGTAQKGGQERDTEWGEWRLRQRRTRTRHGVNNGRGPTREAHEERRQGREL